MVPTPGRIQKVNNRSVPNYPWWRRTALAAWPPEAPLGLKRQKIYGAHAANGNILVRIMTTCPEAISAFRFPPHSHRSDHDRFPTTREEESGLENRSSPSTSVPDASQHGIKMCHKFPRPLRAILVLSLVLFAAAFPAGSEAGSVNDCRGVAYGGLDLGEIPRQPRQGRRSDGFV